MSLNTRGIDPQRLLPQSLEDRLLGWLARLGGVGLTACIAVIWLSLVTWTLSDPSLTHATAAAPRNWMGPLGAIVSDLLLQTFGFAAVIGLVAPIVWTLELMRDQRIAFGRKKFSFYPLSILAIAAALSAFPVFNAWPLHHGFGGVLGDALFKLTVKVFALINEDRAGIAAGLVLNATALTMGAKSIGVDLEEAVQSLLKSKAAIERAAPSLDAALDELDPVKIEAKTQASKWWSFASKAKSNAQSNPYGPAAAIAVPEPYPPPHTWTRDNSVPHLHSYASAAVAAPAGLVAAAAQHSYGGGREELRVHSLKEPPRTGANGMGGFDFGMSPASFSSQLSHESNFREPGQLRSASHRAQLIIRCQPTLLRNNRFLPKQWPLRKQQASWVACPLERATRVGSVPRSII